MRLGLCCLFKKEPVSFRTTTAKSLLSCPRQVQLRKLSEICFHNASNLHPALENDDVSYTPRDILSFCERFSIPFVYGVQHHLVRSFVGC